MGVLGSDGAGVEHVKELEQLARTAGADVVGNVTQRRRSLDASTLVGKGKIDEVKRRVVAEAIDLVVFDDDLSPAQTKTIENCLGVKVIDRSALILDIFARHARTHEAKLQVELAQLQYVLPRLTRMWTHLSRTGGGIGTRGPGETQLEVDRRRIRTRIATLKEKLTRVATERRTQRGGRADLVRVALAGYTNAGKSTLMNALTRAGVPVADKLFETLDTTTRRLYLSPRRTVLISDTVGFIRKLPHHLVASFRSTLDEVAEADLVLHVVDASSGQLDEQIESVDGVLDGLVNEGAVHLLVLNKIDLVTDEAEQMALRALHPGAILTSAMDKEALRRLRETLESEVARIERTGGRRTRASA